jgi:hypothetical protein
MRTLAKESRPDLLDIALDRKQAEVRVVKDAVKDAKKDVREDIDEKKQDGHIAAVLAER